MTEFEEQALETLRYIAYKIDRVHALLESREDASYGVVGGVRVAEPVETLTICPHCSGTKRVSGLDCTVCDQRGMVPEGLQHRCPGCRL